MKSVQLYFLFIFVLPLVFSPSAEAVRCSNLFVDLQLTEFPLVIGGRRTNERYLTAAFERFVADMDLAQVHAVLGFIRDNGVSGLTREQRKIVIRFRQNTSFMRSIIQTSTDRHRRPRRFGEFVRDFGILKDLILAGDGTRARRMAEDILRNYEINERMMLSDFSPANRRSMRRYFRELMNDTQTLMSRTNMTVDDIHSVRKNLRNVLRFLQIQATVDYARQHENPQGSPPDTPQIAYLKNLDAQLGRICDENAGRILSGSLTEDSPMRFPENLRTLVERFLQNYQIIEG